LKKDVAERREQAHEMHRYGATFAQIAAILNCTATAVRQ
jgi:predicted transcriptional regulator